LDPLETTSRFNFRAEDTHYRTGDYWLIPARTATGDIEMAKRREGASCGAPPHGIEHHYAPLAIWSSPEQIKDVRFSVYATKRRK